MGFGIFSDYTLIELPGRVAPYLLDSIQEKLSEPVQEIGGKYVIDMKNVDNVFSATLTLIMHLNKIVCRMKGSLFIANTSEPVRNALYALKIDQRIPVFESVLDFECYCAGVQALSA